MNFSILSDNIFQILTFTIMAVAIASGTADAGTSKGIKLETDRGTMIIKLYPDVAPKTVKQITTLVGEGFYDGIVFHRVLPNFMIQGGDPRGTGSGGSQLPDIPAEFSDRKHVKGTVSMARTSDPNSANSQFFICHTDTSCRHLDGQYSIFGQVVEGLDVIGKVKQGDKMTKVTLVDLP